MVDNKRLDELMLEKYPHIVYTAEQSDEFLKKYEGDLADEDVVAWDFAKYVSRAEKFIIIKTIGKHDNFIIREFDDEESAKSFVIPDSNSDNPASISSCLFSASSLERQYFSSIFVIPSDDLSV